MDGFLYPNMPSGMPVLMAVAALLWLLFLLAFAYSARLRGITGAFNMVSTFLFVMAVGSTIVTSVVWDWAPKQIASNVSTSAGWSLIQDATGGMTDVGNVARANARQSVPFGNDQTTVSVAGGRPGEVSLSPAQAQKTTSFDYTELNAVPVRVTSAQLQLKHWNSLNFDLSAVSATSLPNGGFACGVWQDTTGVWWGVACPSSNGVVFPLAQVAWQEAGIVLPQTSTSTSAKPETISLDQVDGKCIKTELTKAGLTNATTGGSDWLPYSSSWALTSPGWFEGWAPQENELWQLHSNTWGFDFQVNGLLARELGGMSPMFGGASTITVLGTGQIPAACMP